MDELRNRMAALPDVEIDRAPVTDDGGFTVVHPAVNAGVFIAHGRVNVAIHYDEARPLVALEHPDGSVELGVGGPPRVLLRATKAECTDGDMLLYFQPHVAGFGPRAARACVELVRALIACRQAPPAAARTHRQP